MDIGGFIRFTRRKNGLTQTQLAESSEVSVNTIRLCENNKITPKTTTLTQIAKALGFSGLDEFLFMLSYSTDTDIEPLENFMSIGEKIKLSRTGRGLSQTQLETLCGLSPHSVSKYETGSITPKLETLEKISNALKIPLSVYLDNIHDFKIEGADMSYSLAYDDDDDEKIPVLSRIKYLLRLLNITGQYEAVKRIEEMTELTKFQKSINENV